MPKGRWSGMLHFSMMKLFDPGGPAAKQIHPSPGKELTDQVESLFLGTGFLNLHWLMQAADVLLAIHTQVHHQLLLFKPVDKASVSVLMDDNATLLEACNLVKRSMSAAAQSKLHLKYAIRRLSECSFGDQSELLKVRQVLHECVRELQSGTSLQHTGSWLVLEDASSHSKLGDMKTKKMMSKPRIPSQATTDANLVSLVVFTALLAAFNVGGYVDHAKVVVASQQGLGCVERLHRGIREEVQSQGPHRKTAPVLESLHSSFTQMARLTDSLLESPEKTSPGEMKQLVRNASKKLEYFESSLEILEKQVEELFGKIVAHRKVVLYG